MSQITLMTSIFLLLTAKRTTIIDLSSETRTALEAQLALALRQACARIGRDQRDAVELDRDCRADPLQRALDPLGLLPGDAFLDDRFRRCSSNSV